MGKKGNRGSSYKFTKKRHSGLGMSALAIAICSIIAWFVMMIRSYQSEGNMTVYAGSAGLLAMLVAVLSFLMAVKSLKDKEKYKLYPIIATAVSFVISGLWIGVYILGFIAA